MTSFDARIAKLLLSCFICLFYWKGSMKTNLTKKTYENT